ncbi:hypothetical protein ACKFKF_12930 [Phormidesmis sp. 146-12]
MKRFISLMVAVATTLAISTQLVLAQSKPNTSGDARVKAALEKLGWKYEIDRDGDYKLVMDLEGRSQVVFLMSDTNELGEMEIREVSSPGYVTNQPLSAEVANQLLADSARKKLGAWQVVKGDKSYVAVFSTKVNANSKPDELAAAVAVTVKSADAMEKSLTNKDDL